MQERPLSGRRMGQQDDGRLVLATEKIALFIIINHAEQIGNLVLGSLVCTCWSGGAPSFAYLNESFVSVLPQVSVNFGKYIFSIFKYLLLFSKK
jgi:hypothetical protein